MTGHQVLIAAADEPTLPLSDAGDAQLVLAAILAIAMAVLLITWAKFHPFIALTLGSATLAAVAAVAPLDAVDSFVGGVGDTFAGVGILVALGAMLGTWSPWSASAA